MILELDVHTLIAVLIFGHVIINVLLIADVGNGRSTLYDRVFILGKILQLAAWLLFAQRGEISDLLSLFLGNTLFIVGVTFESLALSSLKKTITIKWRLLYGVLLGVLLLSLWNIPFFLDLKMEETITIPLIGILYLIPGCCFIFTRDRTSVLQVVIGIMCVVYFIGTIWRAWYTWNAANYSLFSSQLPNTILLLLTILLLFVGSLGYILVKKEYANFEISRVANIDFLTNIYNRRAFLDFANNYFRLAVREKRDISVLIIDIDFFKSVNDKYGHQVGDIVLKGVAAILQHKSRDYDIVGRFGGEEFALVLPETDSKGAVELAERLRTAVAEYKIEEYNNLGCTISVGAATLTSSNITQYTLEALIGFSDNAMYKAKQLGRNRVEVECPD